MECLFQLTLHLWFQVDADVCKFQVRLIHYQPTLERKESCIALNYRGGKKANDLRMWWCKPCSSNTQRNADICISSSHGTSWRFSVLELIRNRPTDLRAMWGMNWISTEQLLVYLRKQISFKAQEIICNRIRDIHQKSTIELISILLGSIS